MSDLVERVTRAEIRALKAYAVPDATGLVKLDAMENPYPWPDAIRGRWLEALQGVAVNRYPDPRAPALEHALRAAMDIPAESGILLGNGSDELIQMLALTVAGPGRCVLSVDPGFAMYRLIGVFAGLQYVGVPLARDDFALDLPAVLDAISASSPSLVFLAYPNNPTGNLFDAQAVEEILAATPGLVIVDEAYAPFTDASFLPRLGEWPNLLVLRTLSKMGLAGLRLGYLAGPPDLIREIDKTRLPYNVNVLTQASVVFALAHQEVFEAQCRQIRADRDALFATLDGIAGVHPYPSETNFILMRLPVGQARRVFEDLKASGILVKCLDGADPLLADCLRVTVGRPEENRAFIGALVAALER